MMRQHDVVPPIETHGIWYRINAYVYRMGRSRKQQDAASHFWGKFTSKNSMEATK